MEGRCYWERISKYLIASLKNRIKNTVYLSFKKDKQKHKMWIQNILNFELFPFQKWVSESNDVINDKGEWEQEPKVKIRLCNSFLHKTFTEPIILMLNSTSSGDLWTLLTFRENLECIKVKPQTCVLLPWIKRINKIEWSFSRFQRMLIWR